MKVGDLVRIKFTTMASMRRSKNFMGHDPTEPGIVIEVAENACKVIFPQSNGKIRSFIKEGLEVISRE